jgi:hypothetical protein
LESKKLKEPPAVRAAFVVLDDSRDSIRGIRFKRTSILRTEVFNTFVENAVENGLHADVSGSSRDGLAHCTEAGARTFVVALVSENNF